MILENAALRHTFFPDYNDDFIASVVHPLVYSTLSLAALWSISALNPRIQKRVVMTCAEDGFLMCDYYTTHYYIQVL